MNKKNDYINIGEIIKYLRHKQNLSQKELSNEICSRKQLVNIENGKCYPTLYLINAFSEKLGTNLYDQFASALFHNNFDTHKSIIEINEYLHANALSNLPAIIDANINKPGFQTGEPLQVICYAKSLYTSQVLKNYIVAIEFAKKGISVSYSSIDELCSSLPSASSVDILLLNLYIIDSFKIGHTEDSFNCFKNLYNHLIHTISSDKYTVNRNKLLEAKLLGALTNNAFWFFKDTRINELVPRVNQVINKLSELNLAFSMTELLLCKAHYYFLNNEREEAISEYNKAHSVGLVFLSHDYLDNIEKVAVGQFISL